jgi:hypothetical protein
MNASAGRLRERLLNADFRGRVTCLIDTQL